MAEAIYAEKWISLNLILLYVDSNSEMFLIICIILNNTCMAYNEHVGNERGPSFFTVVVVWTIFKTIIMIAQIIDRFLEIRIVFQRLFRSSNRVITMLVCWYIYVRNCQCHLVEWTNQGSRNVAPTSRSKSSSWVLHILSNHVTFK